VSLVVSDVVGDALDVVASGPTAPDPTTYVDALDAAFRRAGREGGVRIPFATTALTPEGSITVNWEDVIAAGFDPIDLALTVASGGVGKGVTAAANKLIDMGISDPERLGVHGTSRTVVRHSVVEAYLFLKRDPNLHSATIGTHWTGELPFRLDYGIEIAAQTGSAGSDTIRAWAGHWQLGETIASDPKLRLIGEYNYASGDRDPSDGRRGTFDQLYPTAHDKYGLADQVGWRNIHDLRLGSEITPTKGWQLTGNYHSWWLADTHDGLYNAAGALIAGSP